MKVQWVWWWRWPYFIIWKFPRTWARPFFYGLYLGVVEIRFWPNRFSQKEKK